MTGRAVGPIDYRGSAGTLAYRLDGEILFRYEGDEVTQAYLIPRDIARAHVLEVQSMSGISVWLRKPREGRDAFAVGFGSTLWSRDEAEDLAYRINRLVGEGNDGG